MTDDTIIVFGSRDSPLHIQCRIIIDQVVEDSVIMPFMLTELRSAFTTEEWNRITCATDEQRRRLCQLIIDIQGTRWMLPAHATTEEEVMMSLNNSDRIHTISRSDYITYICNVLREYGSVTEDWVQRGLEEEEEDGVRAGALTPVYDEPPEEHTAINIPLENYSRVRPLG
jgi:hypothetical protein